jgi:hypothetical protein
MYCLLRLFYFRPFPCQTNVTDVQSSTLIVRKESALLSHQLQISLHSPGHARLLCSVKRPLGAAKKCGDAAQQLRASAATSPPGQCLSSITASAILQSVHCHQHLHCPRTPRRIPTCSVTAFLAMSLYTLPDDLLIEILSYFETDKAALRTLALLFRRLSVYVPSFLFRNAHISSLKTFQLLDRSCRENPELACHVRTWVVSDKTQPYKALVPKHTSRFPNLYKLELYGGFEVTSTQPCPRHRGPPQATVSTSPNAPRPWRRRSFRRHEFGSEFFAYISTSGIKDLHLSRYISRGMAANIPSTVIAQLILTEGLRNLQITNLSELGEIQLPQSANTCKSTVVHLKIGGSQHWTVNPIHLKSLLSCTSSLKHLECSLPGRSRTTHSARTVAHMRHPFCGATFSNVLEPVKDCLEILELDIYRQRWPGRQPFPFDLSGFCQLRKLNIPSICFFQLGPTQIDRYDLSSQLPASLEELSVSQPALPLRRNYLRDSRQ